MMLVYAAFLHFFQDALSVHDKWDSFLPAVVVESHSATCCLRLATWSRSRSSDRNL